jgi:CRP-like cAMP-binding protein
MGALDPYRSGTRLGAWRDAGLLSVGRRRVLREGEILLAQGAAASHAALVTRGLVKISAETAQGEETFLAIRGEGDLIGEEAGIPGNSLQAGGSRPGLTVATALTKATTARVFPVTELREFLEDHPAAMFSVAQGLYERLADAESRIVSGAWENADRRLARLLCDLERYGTQQWLRSSLGIEIPVRLTHAELASWIGASRETADRALRRWRTRGIISMSQRRIVVHDIEALGRIAGVNVSHHPSVRPSTSRISGRQVSSDKVRGVQPAARCPSR